MAISRQNNRSTSRRSDGFPGDFIGDLPVNAFIHPAGLPIDTSTLEVLRRPVEFTELPPRRSAKPAPRWGVLQSMGRVGSALDNAAAEAFNSTIKVEHIHRHRFTTRAEAGLKIATWIVDFYNTRRRHSACDGMSPINYEHLTAHARGGRAA